MKLVHIVAARPNFIKAAPLVDALNLAGFENIIVHTNQHYDYKMSQIFFQELDIPEPKYHLGVKSGTHGEQTGNALIEIERVLNIESPNAVVVYGDVNSTLSATLAAVKLLIPIIHIEAGQRSGDKTMPEEINRILTDHCSTMLMCAEPQALDYLKSENLENYELVGNTAVDCLHRIVPFLKDKKSPIDGEYYVCTLHRPFNVDDPNKLHQILSKLNNFDRPVILPAHPRLKKNLNSTYDNIQFVDPMGYVDFVNHIKHSHGIISDSGGIQCEAAFWTKPIITLRPNTEHKTTLNMGNVLCPNIEELSVDKFQKLNTTNELPWWWDGNASKRVVEQIKKYVEWKKI
jgi:UDP-N-acetylglucosamine 2-epimerase